MLLNRPIAKTDNDISAAVNRGLAAMEQKNWPLAKDCFLHAANYFFSQGFVTKDKISEWHFVLTRLAATLSQLQHFWAAIYITNWIIYLLQGRPAKRTDYLLARSNRAKLYDKLNQRHRGARDHRWLLAQGDVAPTEKFRSQMDLCFLAKKERRYKDYVKETNLAEKLFAQLPNPTAQQRHDLEKYQMFSYLQIGDYQKGFAYYESRFHFAGEGFDKKPQHRDDKKIKLRVIDNAASIKHKTLLVVGDQGLGDDIMFVRFLPLLKKHCQKVIFSPRREQFTLFAGNHQFLSDIDVIKPDDEASFDYWLQLTSLPFHLGLDEKNLPCDIPYLVAPPRERTLPPHDSNKKNIGLVWATGKGGEGVSERSIPLPRLLPLLRCRANFFSFQCGPSQGDIATYGLQGIIHDLSPMINDFADTAAFLQHIDLVISVDTSLTHLAAALGKNVFLLSPYMTDWKWGGHRQPSSRWYPQVIKIFHQTEENTWQAALIAVKNDIEELLNGHRVKNH